MKKFKILMILALFSFNKEIYAQKTTEISGCFAPARVFSTIKSRDDRFNEYVNDRNQTDPKRGGIVLGLTLERPLLNNLKFQTGISFSLYGSQSVLLDATDLQKSINPNRVSFIGRLENYFLNVPFHIKKDIFKFSVKPTKHVKSIDFKIYTTGGVAVSYMFRANYQRTYELQSGEREITENEFENNFDINPFNMLLEVGLGFQYILNQKWTVLVEPSFNYTLFSIYSTGIAERFSVYSTKIGVGMLL